MQKVIVFDMGLHKGVIKEGLCDGVLREKHYLKVGDELFHAACVIKDSSESRCALELVVKANQAAESAKTYANLLGARLLGHHKVA